MSNPRVTRRNPTTMLFDLNGSPYAVAVWTHGISGKVRLMRMIAPFGPIGDGLYEDDDACFVAVVEDIRQSRAAKDPA